MAGDFFGPLLDLAFGESFLALLVATGLRFLGKFRGLRGVFGGFTVAVVIIVLGYSEKSLINGAFERALLSIELSMGDFGADFGRTKPVGLGVGAACGKEGGSMFVAVVIG